MKWSMSHIGMGVAAVATAALIVFAPEDAQDAVSVPTKSRSVAAPRRASDVPPTGQVVGEGGLLASARSRVTLMEDSAERLFSRGSWFVPPPPSKPAPVVAPPPPPPPTAPDLPYTFLGKYSEGDLQLVILSRGNRVITASRGDVLENMYRIDRIEANNVIFTYLPLNTSQTLATGGNP
jgi:hypothetical protein